jgi:YgiT-type zinc finger domain-containing protein
VRRVTTTLDIRTCPTCGSKRIRRVRKSVTRSVHGRTCQVPDVEFHECPACGEKLYGHKAMRQLETYRPSRVRPTFYERTKHLAGSLKGLPRDLSTN